MKQIVASLILCIVITEACSQWTQSKGIWGAEVSSMITLDSTFFISASGNGIYARHSGEEIWVQKCGPAGITDLLTIDTVLFGQGPMLPIFRSFDKGETWHILEPYFTGYVRATPTALFGLYGYYIWRSFDYGDTWEDITENTGVQTNNLSGVLTWDDLILLDYLYDSILIKSTDDGQSWDELPVAGLPMGGYFYLNRVFSRPDEIWLSTTKGVFIHYENSAYWIPVDTLTVDTRGSFYEFHDTLYLGTPKGCYIFNSPDSSWIEVINGLENSEAFSFTNWYDTLYCSSFPGLYKLNASINWVPWNNGLSMRNINHIYSFYDDVWAITTEDIVYRSSDYGETFEKVDSGIVNHSHQMIMTDSLYYMATDIGFFISVDSGHTWLNYNEGLDTLVIRDIENNDQYYFAGTPSGLYRSPPFPIYWNPVNNALGSVSISNFSVNDSIVICTAVFGQNNSSMVRSSDYGENFQALCIDWDCATFSTIYTEPYFYCMDWTDSIYYSPYDGLNWKEIPFNDPVFQGGHFTGNESCFLLGGYKMGMVPYDNFLKITYDLGFNWIDITPGLPHTTYSPKINSLIINDSRIFTAPRYNGLWYRDDLLVKTPEFNKTYQNSIEIWPNPFHDHLTVEFQNKISSKMKLVLFDLLGRIVYQTELVTDGRKVFINDINIRSGIYLLSVRNSNNNFSAKVIKY